MAETLFYWPRKVHVFPMNWSGRWAWGLIIPLKKTCWGLDLLGTFFIILWVKIFSNKSEGHTGWAFPSQWHGRGEFEMNNGMSNCKLLSQQEMPEPWVALETVLNFRAGVIWNQRGPCPLTLLCGWRQEFIGSGRWERGMGSSTEGSQDAFGKGGATNTEIKGISGVGRELRLWV